MHSRDEKLVAVYDDEIHLQKAVDALRRLGIADDECEVREPGNRMSSLESEMRAELLNPAGAPSAAVLAREMTKGVLRGCAVGAVVGVVLALPLAAINIGALPVWTRLLVALAVGISLGGMIGAVIGSGLGAVRFDEPLAAEHGITLAVPSTSLTRATLLRTDAARIDFVDADGSPIDVLAERERPPAGVPKIAGRRSVDDSVDG